jgi:hypothetical protein
MTVLKAFDKLSMHASLDVRITNKLIAFASWSKDKEVVCIKYSSNNMK